MPRVHVSPLSRIGEVTHATGARDLVTLINVGTPVEPPHAIERHLFIGMSDILEARDGHVAPGRDHVTQLLSFVRAWDRRAPVIIHCWAGVSRSTAAAFVSVCALNPARDEQDVARALRKASPTATPNLRFVTIADDLLGRGGRMRAAIESIGRGQDCFEGEPFALDIERAK